MKCKSCGEDVKVTNRICPKCQKETGSVLIKAIDIIILILKKALTYLILFSIWVVESLKKLYVFAKPRVLKFLSVKRNRYISLGVLGSMIVIIVIVSLVKKPDTFTPSLQLGEEVTLSTSTVSFFGSDIFIDDEDSILYGLELVVDSFSFEDDETFTISYQEIERHDFGEYFTPVSPLITIDYSHQYATYPMTLTIPISIEEDEFAMGFYYDSDTLELEAIPVSNLTTEEITLVTNHFSSIVISKISFEDLDHITSTYVNQFDTGFTPGIDDWQFTNYGSYIAPSGHCAGQTLTMGYYYTEKVLKENQNHLFGLFDNNGLSATTSFWQDDSNGYRFASTVQTSIDWYDEEFINYIDYGTDHQNWVYYAFGYAMYITGEPQFMAIYSHDSFGDIVSGHAILAYKFVNGKIYVADPNYPGMSDRYVEFSNNAFLPYSSGANAAMIDESGTILYDQILFIGTSALVDYDQMDQWYLETLDGTIGRDVFPELSSLYLTDYDTVLDNQVWEDIENDQITLTTSHNSLMSCSLQNKVVLAFTVEESTSIVYTFYQGDTLVGGPYTTDEYGYLYKEFDLEIGDNEIGVLVEYSNGYDFYYIDFQRINITYEGGVTTPCASTVVGRYNFISRSDNQVLVTYNYIEVYQDGTWKEEYQLNDGSGYISINTGTWTIEPGDNAGENILVLSMVYTSDYYLIVGDYEYLQRTSGDVLFIYQKVD
ncbi:MAG: hypothetical protein AB7U79_05820 [Candidatus Izemoplasmatales bacterium]